MDLDKKKVEKRLKGVEKACNSLKESQTPIRLFGPNDNTRGSNEFHEVTGSLEDNDDNVIKKAAKQIQKNPDDEFYVCGKGKEDDTYHLAGIINKKSLEKLMEKEEQMHQNGHEEVEDVKFK